MIFSHAKRTSVAGRLAGALALGSGAEATCALLIHFGAGCDPIHGDEEQPDEGWRVRREMWMTVWPFWLE